MSIVAKQYLLKQVGNELGDSLSANDLQIVQDKLNNILSMYEVEDIEDGQIDGEADDFLNAFLDAKEIEGRSQKTIKHYRYIITKMMKEINIPIRRITVFHLRNYLMRKKSNGIQDKTLEGCRSVMCSYFGWLQKEGLLEANPCANLAPIKCVKKVRVPYTEVDIERLKESCWCTGIRARLHNIAKKADIDNVHPHRFRRTLATTLINHGMQIQEVASILGHDKLDTTMNYVYIDKTKIKNSYRKFV
jgi:site-specific recombinase XerD